ncbi:ribulokinase [Actinomyces culturomici]|uniref:ribulokinase n=1 Tax=Actinomyces culturomici TaxID=1926276 RepID=UPI000E2008BB|nr:ribulokinase [Actinomyces culturomici]
MVNDDFSQAHVLGLDFGTLSVRAAVVRVNDGAVLADAVSEYATPIMDRTLAVGDGRRLPAGFALQVPSDYLASMREAVPAALAKSGVDPDSVIGIGIDATSSTVLMTDAQGVPMCERPEFVNEPQAYLKLWKHHGAQDQTDRIVALAKERNEPWLARYGGILSSEMLMPKALEALDNAPKLFAATEEIVDLVDWVTWRLTGVCAYSAADSGYKRMYQDGAYPSKEYLAALDPRFANVFEEKMSHEIVPLGARIGSLTAEFARDFGLPAGIAVATGNIDAHVQCASVDAVRPGQLTGILGTSTCWILPSATLEDVPGVFGVVDGGVCAGHWAYEAGQSAVGDIFAWFIDHCVPGSYFEEAKERGVSIHRVLGEKAEKQEVGEHGLIALDWWNGNRSTLVDSRLSGLMIGQTLTTTAEDQYRALLESTAFGARVIIENFEEHGVPVDEIRVAGGLLKDAFLMQMYADITRRPLLTATTLQAGAHGSAIFAAVAAGAYESVPEASAVMGGVSDVVYRPDEERAARYDALYALYRRLYDRFGLADETMHELRRISAEAAQA